MNQTSMCLDGQTYLSPQVIFLLTVPRWCFVCESLFLFVFRVCLCHTFLSVPCSIMVTCWERADLLVFLCVMFLVSFPYGVLGQVWYLIVLILDLRLLPDFECPFHCFIILC